MRYRIVFVIETYYGDSKKIIKSGFTSLKAAEEWNVKHGNPGYKIEPY